MQYRARRKRADPARFRSFDEASLDGDGGVVMTDSSRGRTYGSAAPAGRARPDSGRPPAQRGSSRPGGRPDRDDPAPKRPRKTPVWTWLTISLGAIVLLIGVGGFGALSYTTHKVDSALKQTDLLGSETIKGNSIK